MRIVPLPLLALAACSQPVSETAAVDIGNAARAAQGAVDHYAASQRAAPTPRHTPARPPPPLAASDTPTETLAPPDSAQDAAAVVRTYYALIAAGKYRNAWQLWDDDGQATGMTATAFAASFAKYRDHHAEVGAPGEIEAGAGQRYVTIPVKISGHLNDGNRPFALAGPITLHRTGDIDGATVDQRSWRISASGVRPRPVEADATLGPEASTPR